MRCNMQVVWVAGKIEDMDQGCNSWQLQGVFATAEEANKICVSPLHFYGPVPFGQALPEEEVEWPGVVYPVTE